MFEDCLRKALREEQFHLLYQPQVDLLTGKVIGAEALVRWDHPEEGVVSPDQFIELAEDTGLILQLGEWVLRAACLQLRTWQDLGAAPFSISVNVSAAQFRQDGFLDVVDSIVRETGIDPCFLEFEMTETVLMENDTVNTLALLKQRGICLAIDDFGTGYSSLSYLRHFPIDRIKIDKSFVHGITSNTSDAVIVRTILAMARTLRLTVLAEGVETGDQFALLQELKCDQAQGYFLGRPVPPQELLTRMLQPSVHLNHMPAREGQADFAH